MSTPSVYRVLIIDDNPAIHEDFRKIFAESTSNSEAVASMESLLFGDTGQFKKIQSFELRSALQGQEGLETLQQARSESRPFALAFVDMRMPPGWDGLRTVQELWKVDPELQIVICTAYSDFSWRDIMKAVGVSDNLLILKKPFDSVEVLQLVHALTNKWNLGRQARLRLEDLDRMVHLRTEALCASEERFAKAFNTSPIPNVIQNLETERLVDVNESFLEMTGRTREECLGRTFTELQLWADAEVGQTILATLKRDHCLRSVHCRLRAKSGKLCETFLQAEPMVLRQDKHVLLVVEDMTERVNLENQLRQAHKMEAVGQLAAGIAHDFNNILTIVQGHVSFLLGNTKLDAAVETQMKHVLGASERAAMLTRQLLAFSRKQMMQRRPLSLEMLLEQHGQMLRRLIGEHIALEVHCTPNLPPVFADSCNIEQVIMNLAVNGRDAMPEGGKLIIQAKAVHFKTGQIDVHSEARPGNFVCLTVSDTGIGMDEETLRHAFEPFFTTKEVGKGTGMGLATVYGIIKQHEGWIEVTSKVGQGSMFKVYLPVSTKPLSTGHTDRLRAPVPGRGGAETILVVEDEAFLREFVQTVLRGYGYHILAASDGHEAVRLFQEAGGKVDLLLTDMVMPGGMTGRELVEILSRQKPDLRAVFTSGYSRDVLGPELKWDNERTFLQKPYQSQVLVETVRTCLDEGGRCGAIVNNSWAVLP